MQHNSPAHGLLYKPYGQKSMSLVCRFAFIRTVSLPGAQDVNLGAAV